MPGVNALALRYVLRASGLASGKCPDFLVGPSHQSRRLPRRLSPLGHVVPVGPAQCCSVCLSSTVHPINQCDDL